MGLSEGLSLRLLESVNGILLSLEEVLHGAEILQVDVLECLAGWLCCWLSGRLHHGLLYWLL